MDKLHAFAMHVWLGMPVWCWGLCAFLIGVDELLVMFGRKSRALSIFRSAFRLLLSVPLLSSVLVRLPLLGSVLKACAGIEPISTAEADALKAASGAVGGQKGSALLSVVLALAAVGLIGGAALLAGCGTAGGQALGKCELGAMPQQAEAVIAAVAAVLSNTSDINWVGDLEALGVKAGPSLVDCTVAAITAAASAQMPSHGQPEPMLLTTIQRGQIWAKSHPAKCCAK